jgi:hypothetical protein
MDGKLHSFFTRVPTCQFHFAAIGPCIDPQRLDNELMRRLRTLPRSVGPTKAAFQNLLATPLDAN